MGYTSLSLLLQEPGSEGYSERPWSPAASLQRKVRPEPGSALSQILSYTEIGDRCQVCEQLPEQADHCSPEKAEEKSDCSG